MAPTKKQRRIGRDPAGEALRSALKAAYPRDARDWLAKPFRETWPFPEDYLVPRRPSVGPNASPTPFFDWLRSRMTLQDLSHLSDSSPGYWKEYGCLASICGTGLLPARYHDLDGVSIARYESSESYPPHARAMACAILLICDGAAWDDGYLSIAVLMQSSLSLDTGGRSRVTLPPLGGHTG